MFPGRVRVGEEALMASIQELIVGSASSFCTSIFRGMLMDRPPPEEKRDWFDAGTLTATPRLLVASEINALWLVIEGLGGKQKTEERLRNRGKGFGVRKTSCQSLNTCPDNRRLRVNL